MRTDAAAATQILTLTAGLGPLLVCVAIDWLQRHPVRMHACTFATGAALAAPALLWGLLSSRIFDGPDLFPGSGDMGEAFLRHALPEELLKLGGFLVWFRLRRLDPRDAVAAAVAVAMGFAAVENVLYVLAAEARGHEWWTTAIVRTLFATPSHALNAIVLGSFVALARIERQSLLVGATGLAVATAAHGIWNTTVFLFARHAEPVFPALPTLVQVVLLIALVLGLAGSVAVALLGIEHCRHRLAARNCRIWHRPAPFRGLA